MAFYQQGDVLLLPIQQIPNEAQPRGDNHLAEGELTGHYHGAIESSARVLEFDGRRFLSAPRGSEVRHQEHKPISVPPGDYEVRIVQEYDHFAEEARAVRD